jgi:hypothetical protein
MEVSFEAVARFAGLRHYIYSDPGANAPGFMLAPTSRALGIILIVGDGSVGVATAIQSHAFRVKGGALTVGLPGSLDVRSHFLPDVPSGWRL